MKYFLNTPIGEIPFNENENNFYDELTDKELLKKYLEEKEKTGFINPKTFEVLRKRNLLFLNEKESDIKKRYNDLKMKGE